MTEGNGVVVILEHEETLLIGAEVLQFFILTLLKGSVPLFGGNLYFDNQCSVEEMLNEAIVDDNAAAIPFSDGIEFFVTIRSP